MCTHELEYKLLNRLKLNWSTLSKWLKILSLYLSKLLAESPYTSLKQTKNKPVWVSIPIEIYRHKFDILLNISDTSKLWDENLILIGKYLKTPWIEIWNSLYDNKRLL